jgi:hypothetical protein
MLVAADLGDSFNSVPPEIAKLGQNLQKRRHTAQSEGIQSVVIKFRLAYLTALGNFGFIGGWEW